jgi:CheY-like chemotaxis protein
MKLIKDEFHDRVKIIMFTNLNDKQNLIKSKELGADDFLLKANTTPKQAVDKVKEILALK